MGDTAIRSVDPTVCAYHRQVKEELNRVCGVIGRRGVSAEAMLRIAHGHVYGFGSNFGSVGRVPWPFIYRKHAISWWRNRVRWVSGYRPDGVSPLEWSRQLDYKMDALYSVTAVLQRQNSDHDVLDGRSVVTAWRVAFGRPSARPFHCGCGASSASFGYVYVMAHAPYLRRFKIGKTNNVATRARGISMQSGLRVEPISFVRTCCYDSAGNIESIMHRHMDDRRLEGEWFGGSMALAESVGDALSDLFRPPSRREWQSANGLFWSIIHGRIAGVPVNEPQRIQHPTLPF